MQNTPEYESLDECGDNVQSRRSAPSSGSYALSQNPAHEQRPAPTSTHQADSSCGGYALSQNPAYEQRPAPTSTHQADSSCGGYALSQNPAYGQIHATAL